MTESPRDMDTLIEKVAARLTVDRNESATKTAAGLRLMSAGQGASTGAALGGLYGLVSPGDYQDEDGKYKQRGRLAGGLRGALAGAAVGGLAGGAAGHAVGDLRLPGGRGPFGPFGSTPEAAATNLAGSLGRSVDVGVRHGAITGGALGAAHGAIDPGATTDEAGQRVERNRLVGALRGAVGGTVLGTAAGLQPMGVLATSPMYRKAIDNVNNALLEKRMWAEAQGRKVAEEAPVEEKQASFLGLNHGAQALLSNAGNTAATGAVTGGLYGLVAPGYTQDENGNYVQRNRLLGAARGAAAGAAVGGLAGGLVHHLRPLHPDVVGTAHNEVEAVLNGLPTIAEGGRVGTLAGAGLGAVHGAIDPGAARDDDGVVRQRGRALGAVRGALGGAILGNAAGGGAVANNLAGQISNRTFIKKADWRSTLAKHTAGLGHLRAPAHAALSSAIPGAIMGGLHGAISPGYTTDEHGRVVQKSRLMGALGGAATGGLLGGVSGGLAHYVQPRISAHLDAAMRAPIGAAAAAAPVAAAPASRAPVAAPAAPPAATQQQLRLPNVPPTMPAPKVAEGLGDVKQADWRTEFARRATGAGGLAGLGMGAGIAGGAALGALTHRDEQGNHAPISGALGGAFKGMQVGLLGGAAAGALKPEWGGAALKNLAGREDALGKMVRYGGRQVRSLTGVGDTKVLRGGLYDAEKALQHAHTNAAQLPAGAVQRAQQRVDVLRDTHERGLDHLPGLVDAVRKDGLVPTLGRTISTQWHGGDAVDKAFLVGGAALPLGMAALTPDDGTGKGKHWGAAVGSAFGNLITPSHMPNTGASLAGFATERAGHLVGSGVDAARRAIAPRPPTQPPQLPPPGYAPQAPMVG